MLQRTNTEQQRLRHPAAQELLAAPTGTGLPGAPGSPPPPRPVEAAGRSWGRRGRELVSTLPQAQSAFGTHRPWARRGGRLSATGVAAARGSGPLGPSSSCRMSRFPELPEPAAPSRGRMAGTSGDSGLGLRPPLLCPLGTAVWFPAGPAGSGPGGKGPAAPVTPRSPPGHISPGKCHFQTSPQGAATTPGRARPRPVPDVAPALR